MSGNEPDGGSGTGSGSASRDDAGGGSGLDAGGTRQLPLALRASDSALLATFHPAGNEALIAALGRRPRPGLWLWGAPRSGRSHLLQATCAAEPAGRAAYLPLGERLAPAVLEGLGRYELVGLDDLDRVAGDEAWEAALFRFYNELVAAGGRLVAAGAQAPAATGFSLPDLASRFAALAVFRVRELDERGRIAALRLRARHRGLELPEETAHYLLKRVRRDMGSLYEWLDRLDTASLAAGRRLTVPFVSSVLSRATDLPEGPPAPRPQQRS